MSRLKPLPLESIPELAELLPHFRRGLGFVPNSVAIMARRPKLAKAFAALNGAVMEGSVPPGFKRLLGHVSSRAAGCRYCMAHTIHGAGHNGIDEAKLAAVWDYATSPLFSDAERAALDFAVAAAAVPNAVDDAIFANLKQHWSEEQIVEMLAAVAMYGFLNRWNDTLATELEDAPLKSGDALLRRHGWSAGKHAARPA
ncbi:MAG: carboxymuconolactone decarboxylase family protein [Alphaproteobacteria bacterium]|nr:carboxymuconolactone decarboxylase family protein [Alphaproteobacteria bacterium]